MLANPLAAYILEFAAFGLDADMAARRLQSKRLLVKLCTWIAGRTEQMNPLWYYTWCRMAVRQRSIGTDESAWLVVIRPEYRSGIHAGACDGIFQVGPRRLP